MSSGILITLEQQEKGRQMYKFDAVQNKFIPVILEISITVKDK